MSPRDHARRIWQAGVDAVKPGPLVASALTSPALASAMEKAPHILVLGCGKAGAAMAAAVEHALASRLDRMQGWVNIPAGTALPLRRIHLHEARPAGSNHPTAQGVLGAERILQLAREAGPEDVALCLLSGGGSALLPAPAPPVTLADKQEVTRLLHACGATIHEMNAVRKHLSAIKGGRLAQAFRGKQLFSLIISDVIGDPLDVIASGPTAADPTTFADSLSILDRFGLREKVPQTVRQRLQAGAVGTLEETPRSLPSNIHNLIIGNNRTAFDASWAKARELGYEVSSLGQPIQGEARQAAEEAMRLVRECRRSGKRMCLIGGGETTVTLSSNSGKGGRNQEWVLAALCEMGEVGLEGITLLSGGTDGEDGPTDAAGALADRGTLERARQLRLSPVDFLHRHDAYPFFQATGDLLLTGLTNTNVMDLQVVLIHP